MRKKILWITETAMMLGLLVAVQGLTAGMQNQILTGSCVNLILVVAAMIVGPWGGAVVAVVSPFLAFLFGIGPKFVQLLPAIAAGNLVLVLIYSLVLGKTKKPIWLQAVVWIGASAAKFGMLYLLMVKLLVPGLVSGGTIAAAAGEKLSAQFGILQMFTALIGGAVALLIVPLLRKALHKGG